MDPARDKFIRLMAKVQAQEARIEDLELEIKTAAEAGDEKARNVFLEELSIARSELAKYRNELARISDGCGKPHAM
jgi:predicted  nucleic acid-binding Zn-ribbon protein